MVTVGVISPALRDRAKHCHLRICIAHQGNLASSYPEMITLIIPRSPLECSPNREEVLWGESSSTPEIKTDKILSFSNDHLWKNLIISRIVRNDKGEFLKIMSNQKFFAKNKEYIFKPKILWNRLNDIWKYSENIVGEAVYQLYIKRLKYFA